MSRPRGTDDRLSRWALEIPLALVFLLVGLVKLFLPDPSALVAMAARTRLSPELVRSMHDVMAVFEVVLGLALLARIWLLAALKASLLLSVGAGLFWVWSDLGRSGCSCVGRISLSPAARLILILALVALSASALWRRLPAVSVQSE